MMLHIPAQVDLRDHDLRMRGIRLEGAFRNLRNSLQDALKVQQSVCEDLKQKWRETNPRLASLWDQYRARFA